MFKFLKKLFNIAVVAEVDGIKFYSTSALYKYLEKQKLEKSRAGKHLYTFEIPWHQNDVVAYAQVGLEERNCFDYTVSENSIGDITIKYWSPQIILKWKKT